MLTKFIEKNLKKAKYKVLEDGTYFGEFSNLKGVWSNSKSLEGCKKDLKEILEEWLILKIKDGDNIPGLSFKLHDSRKFEASYSI